MTPNLGQVLKTLAHEFRTPLAVSQGYVRLYLDGRLAGADEARQAFEETRDALDALGALCADMGKVGALSDKGATGIPLPVASRDLLAAVLAQREIQGATSHGEPSGSVATPNAQDLSRAIAVVANAALRDAPDTPCAIRASANDHLLILAGAPDALDAVASGPASPSAQPMNSLKGGNGLTLIWAAFVLDKHRVETWTAADRKAAVGFRIPLLKAR